MTIPKSKDFNTYDTYIKFLQLPNKSQRIKHFKYIVFFLLTYRDIVLFINKTTSLSYRYCYAITLPDISIDRDIAGQIK